MICYEGLFFIEEQILIIGRTESHFCEESALVFIIGRNEIQISSLTHILKPQPQGTVSFLGVYFLKKMDLYPTNDYAIILLEKQRRVQHENQHYLRGSLFCLL